MATVYLADDLKHGAAGGGQGTARRGRAASSGASGSSREIEIAAGLSHPHILPLHDSGRGAPEGGDSLHSLFRVAVRRRRIAPRPAAPRARLRGEACVSVGRSRWRSTTRTAGVVHLDIKPENILLQEGHAIVADFGIARAMSRRGDDDGCGETRSLGRRPT